jgi:hypothetical protein
MVNNTMRGRKSGSKIRSNISSLILHMGKSYGYQIYKAYIEVFEKVHMRSIYYHLKKGVINQEFVVEEIKKEKGNYTWGSETERIYYSAGPNIDARSLTKDQIKKLS